MEAKAYIDKLMEFGWNYGPKVLTALLILIIGLWLIRRLSNGFQVFLKARKVDESLRPFFASLVDVALKIALLLVVAGQVGIQTTSFIAIFSAIAFAIGLALQGSLGNFASGVLILLFRPYKVGDLLTVTGLSGRVKEIQIFSTILLTPQGKKIIIPNGKMTEGAIENIPDNAEVQVEATLLVVSGTALEALRQAAMDVAQNCPTALHDKPADVVIAGITRDDMKVKINFWTIGENYEKTMDYLHQALRTAFETNNIELAKERRKEVV